mmetsp:Transcript_5441/g.15335  ORF Transcript_5441/g.15335 Transcript_5441/m.15335 type:complete len:205 (+) Transcript_5441:318-932(+)
MEMQMNVVTSMPSPQMRSQPNSCTSKMAIVAAVNSARKGCTKRKRLAATPTHARTKLLTIISTMRASRSMRIMSRDHTTASGAPAARRSSAVRRSASACAEGNTTSIVARTATTRAPPSPPGAPPSASPSTTMRAPLAGSEALKARTAAAKAAGSAGSVAFSRAAHASSAPSGSLPAAMEAETNGCSWRAPYISRTAARAAGSW